MADLISTVSTALSLVMRLKEINQKVKNAEFANLLAGLSLELAQAKAQIAGLIEENTTLHSRVARAETAAGERCPRCKKDSFELVESRPHPLYAEVGIKERTYKCAQCGFTEAKTVE